MSRYWSPSVHGLTPYVPGEQPQIADLVKLNTNENPYGPSPRALEAMRAEVGDSLRRYPDPVAAELRQVLARHFQLSPECVFVGNGSDEVLAHAFFALLNHGRPVLFPDITYSFYVVYCGLYGIEAGRIPLAQDFRVRLSDYHRPNGGIVLSNPNAPTGIALTRDDIQGLLERNTESVVVVDEAYVDFGAESAASLVARHPQLLVIQTTSKSRSLAGLRVGFALGQAPLIEALSRVKDSFNSYPLDRIALAGAKAAIEDQAYFERTCAQVIESREALSAALSARGLEVLPSSANFVFARHPRFAGRDLMQALRARGVLVRHFSAPRIDAFLRITVGLPAENARLLLALDEIL